MEVLFVALHESGIGTFLPSRQVTDLVVIGGGADIEPERSKRRN
jgi:hypothetical protein